MIQNTESLAGSKSARRHVFRVAMRAVPGETHAKKGHGPTFTLDRFNNLRLFWFWLNYRGRSGRCGGRNFSAARYT